MTIPDPPKRAELIEVKEYRGCGWIELAAISGIIIFAVFVLGIFYVMWGLP